MKKVCMMFADGLEEVEALAPLDLLRRGAVDVTTVSITGKREVTGAHQIPILTDRLFDQVDFDQMDMIILPGGMPGTLHLEECEPLKEKLLEFAGQKKHLAAICAAPRVLGSLGILKGKRATCYPGNEDQLLEALVSEDFVVTDGNITTAKGMGAAVDFGLELLRILIGEEKMQKIKDAIMYPKHS